MSDVGADTRELLLRALQRIEAQARELESLREQRASVVVTGRACRFPGGHSDPTELAKLFDSSSDVVGPVPPERWDASRWSDSGTGAGQHGAFLARPHDFDPEFFGLSAAEARFADPQQRLALELAYEALENAGYAPRSLGGTRTAVFAAVSTIDWGASLAARLDPQRIGMASGLGAAHSALPGRIAHLLGLEGPALVVDTACSSSLVALHLAVRGLRGNEFDRALVVGVNLLLEPHTQLAFSNAKMLGPSGHCKAFSASADGYVRGEGGGAFVLERERDAGERCIHARILGTATGADGRASGLTVPNGLAQERVIRAALADAGRTPDDIDEIEAHGTGTPLGDPIELAALGRVFAERSRKLPHVLVASSKGHLGHTEAAAGSAGLLRVLAEFEQQRTFAQAHFDVPSPHVDWSALPLEIPSRSRPFDDATKARTVGISSFGFAGTNAHVVVESVARRAPDKAVDQSRLFVCLSAAHPDSLVIQAARVADALESRARMIDVALTLNVGRDGLRQRAVFEVAGTLELARALRRFASGDLTSACAHDSASDLSAALDLDAGELDAIGARRWVAGGRLVRADALLERGARFIELPTQVYRRRELIPPQGFVESDDTTLMLRKPGWAPIAVDSGNDERESPRRVLLVGPRDVCDFSEVALDSRSSTVATLSPTADGWMLDGEPQGTFDIAWRNAAKSVGDESTPLDVVHVVASDGPEALAAQLAAAAELYTAVATSPTTVQRVMTLTHSAQVHPADSPSVDPHAAAVLGLARCAALEDPRATYSFVDVASAADRVRAYELFIKGQLPSEAANAAGIALRAGAWFAATLDAIDSSAVDARGRSPESILICGGTGGVGSALAAGLLELGARRVVLASRSASPATSATDPRITTAQLDVRDSAAVRVLVERLHADSQSLDAIVHAAGVLDDAPLGELDATRMQTVLAPKVAGARALLTALESHADIQLLFLSSAVARAGNAGQASYAAANACVEALGSAAAAAGRKVKALSYGPWKQTGMTRGRTDLDAYFRRRGVHSLTVKQGVDACIRALLGSHPVLVASAERANRAAREERPRPAPPFAHDAVAALSPAARRAALRELLLDTTAELLDSPRDAIELSSNALDLGFDSLSGVELAARLSASLHADVSVAELLELESLEAAVDLLESALLGAQSDDGSLQTELLNELENLSDDEAAGLLGDAQADSSG